MLDRISMLMKLFNLKNRTTLQWHRFVKIACLLVYPFVLMVGDKISVLMLMYIVVYPLLQLGGVAGNIIDPFSNEILNMLLNLFILVLFYYLLFRLISSCSEKKYTQKKSLICILAILSMNYIPFLAILEGHVFSDFYGVLSNGIFLSLSIGVIIFELLLIKRLRQSN